jgi:hypothetical protein
VWATRCAALMVQGTEKAKSNDLKNRFRLQGNQIVGFPGSSDSNNQRAVTLEGFGP